MKYWWCTPWPYIRLICAKGVSGQLLRFAEQYAREHGKHSIRLDVYERNIPRRTVI